MCLPNTPLPRTLLSCSGAQPFAQVSDITLPDELVCGILRRAWADRSSRPIAEEVSAAADLTRVCRRVRELLRAAPLPLALDFSAWRLSRSQCNRLLEPAHAGRVEAAKFFVGVGGSEDAVWVQPVLDQFLARHGGTLLHLSGVPLQLVARASQEARPVLDLSGMRLTKLGVDCYGSDNPLLVGPPASVWLWPECLPGALEELELLGLRDGCLENLAWAPCLGAGVAGRLPRLRTLRVTSSNDDRRITITNIPILEGFSGLQSVEVEGNVRIDAGLFERVRNFRVVAGGYLRVFSVVESVAVFTGRLCSAGLQAAELRAEGRGVCLGTTGAPVTRAVVRQMISGCEARFALEVGVADDPDAGPGNENRLLRLAWRRWPAPGALGLTAARAAHERARAWAAAGGQ